mgnify:CR=1 FL=1
MKGARDRRREKVQAGGPRRHDAAAPAMPRAQRLIAHRPGALPAEVLPLILEVEPSDDYALIDSGDGRKLEQYGPYRIDRPEGQAIWQRALPESEWARADAVFPIVC